MEYTSNFNLKKPAQEDNYNIADFNENMDTIDKSLGDPLPIGSVIEYAGTEVPQGWEAVTENDYSLEETFTGKCWVDGKKIYRKVFFNYFNDEYNSWYSIGNITNLKTVTKVEGMIKQKDDGNFINFPRCTIPDNASSDLYINGSTGAVNIRIGKATGELYLIVEYTKTTD